MSGADVRYSVLVDFQTKGLDSLSKGLGIGAMSKLGDIEKGFTGIAAGFSRSFGSAIDGVGSALIDTIGTAAKYGGVTLAAGLGAATKTGLGFNAMLESATISLATIQDMQLGIGIEQGMRGASRAIREATKDAARLPGELKDLVGIMQSVAPAALTRGVGMDRLEKMSANAMAAAAAMGVTYTVAGRQLAATLEGRATSAMAFPMRLGLDRHALKKMTGLQRADAVESSLAKAGPSIALFQQSWAGLTSTAKDTGRQLAGVMTQPLFGSIKGELGRGLEWFAGNEDKANRWAATLGVGIDNAFHLGIDKIRLWTPAALAFGRTLSSELQHGFHVAEPYLVRFEKLALRFAADPNAGHMLASAGMGLAGAKVASMGLDLGIDSLRTFGPLLSVAGFSAAELTAAALPASVAVAALGVSAYGAFDILTDSSNAWHGFAMQQVKDTGAEFTHLVGATAGLTEALRPVADAMGANLLLSINLTVGALDLVVSSMTAFYGGMQKLIELIPGVKSLPPTPLGGAGYPYSANPWQYSGASKSIDSAVDDYVGKAPHVHNHNTTINGGITIKVVSNSDPGRIAKKTFDIFREQLRNPTTVPTPNGQLYR